MEKNSNSSKSPYPGTQAVFRAFQLLKLFDDEHPLWTLSDLVQATALKQTTVFRFLAALEQEGMIRRTPTGEYTLGDELIVLGGRAIRANRLRDVARPHLRRLSLQTTESTTLDILWYDEQTGFSSVVIDEVLGQHLLGLVQYTGVRLPAHVTSTGKVLLAWQAPERWPMILEQPLVRCTPHSITDPDPLQRELINVRAQGFATAMGELDVGIMAAAAPVLNNNHEIQAAISVSGPSTRINEGKLLQLAEQVKQTAAQVSYQIGYRA